MSDVLSSYERDKNSKLPLLHFGLITLDENLGFVAGGFSRVYFGTLKHQRVAVKVMFAMELTSSDVEDFFNETKVCNDVVITVTKTIIFAPKSCSEPFNINHNVFCLISYYDTYIIHLRCNCKLILFILFILFSFHN